VTHGGFSQCWHWSRYSIGLGPLLSSILLMLVLSQFHETLGAVDEP
jgi:hypothetical protein